MDNLEDINKKKDEKDKKEGDDKKKKFESKGAPTHIAKRRRGPAKAHKLPNVTPNVRCKLKLLKLERVKDFLLIEEEFIQNQELLKPREEKNPRRTL